MFGPAMDGGGSIAAADDGADGDDGDIDQEMFAIASVARVVERFEVRSDRADIDELGHGEFALESVDVGYRMPNRGVRLIRSIRPNPRISSRSPSRQTTQAAQLCALAVSTAQAGHRGRGSKAGADGPGRSGDGRREKSSDTAWSESSQRLSWPGVQDDPSGPLPRAHSGGLGTPESRPHGGSPRRAEPQRGGRGPPLRIPSSPRPADPVSRRLRSGRGMVQEAFAAAVEGWPARACPPTRGLTYLDRPVRGHRRHPPACPLRCEPRRDRPTARPVCWRPSGQGV